MKQSLLKYWKLSGTIKDRAALEAFESVKRENFVLKDYVHLAYEDMALPIHAKQTISQPTTVMIMTQALEARKGQRILEVGTGSGYQAAILAKIVGSRGRIVSTEIIPELYDFARKNLQKEGIKNVKVLNIDGSCGYQREAPYDRIIVTAAAPSLPSPLIGQLRDNGIIIAPVGSLHTQEMVRIRKRGRKLLADEMGYFIFVPLKGKHGIKQK